MTRRFFVVLTVLILSVAFPIVAANADEIVITSGSAIAGADRIGTVDVTGTQGFEWQMRLGLDSAGPWFSCMPCGAPGDVWPGLQKAFFDSFDGGGTVKLDGNVFSLGLGFGEADAVLSLIAGSLILPPMSTRAVLSAPFEVKESFFSLHDFRGEPTVRFPLAGRGLATVELVPNPFAPLWEFSSVRYDFAPTPEPGTLSLLGSALAAGVVRCRRRSHS